MSDSNASSFSCADYRRLYSKHTHYPVPKEVWDSEEGNQWSEHGVGCSACIEWSMGQEVEKRGRSVTDFPCVHMAYYGTFRCQDHPDPWDCADYVLVYNPRFDEYSIPIRDGGSSMLGITHCPWCGVQLPKSRREEYANHLRALGFEEIIFNPEIPEKYRTDRWWRGKATLEDWWPRRGSNV